MKEFFLKLFEAIKNAFRKTESVKIPIETQPNPTTSGKIQASLSWEVGYPERKAWSDSLFSLISNGDTFNALCLAQDIKEIRPDFSSLTKDQKATVLCELVSAMSKFESSWNPASYSVDVGSKDNRDTWSVGLMQMSVVDQTNYGFNLGYDFQDLQLPVPNLKLAVLILAKQVQKHGLLMIPNGESGLYWAVLHPGGKYDQSKNIIAMVQNIKFVSAAQDSMPWMTFAKSYLGLRELVGGQVNPFVTECFSYTNYPTKQNEAWCAAFACLCLEKAGFKSSHDPAAASFIEYGTPCELKPGCIVVIEHLIGSLKGHHHVTFCYDVGNSLYFTGLGGNQNDCVCAEKYTSIAHKIVATRWPVISVK